MRASELLGRPARTAGGASLGVVHDVVVRRAAGVLDVVAVVVGPGTWSVRAAYTTGYGQGRTQGPQPLRALLRRGCSQVVEVDVGDVVAWSDHGVLVVADRAAGGRR